MAADHGLCVFPTAIGGCAVVWGNTALRGVQLPEADDLRTLARLRRRFPDVQEQAPPEWVRAAIARVQAVLTGHKDDLADVPLDLSGVPEFNRRVYEAARTIPPGFTRTYGEVARELGQPGAARAVGQALGHNPFAPIVPCHRVLAARSAGGGFSAEGGVATKLRMLQIENARIGSEPGLFD
jgi:methylated-DNA-[protein]-cysteine S-methyltransferase